MKNIKGSPDFNYENFDEAMINAQDKAESICSRIQNQLSGTNLIKIKSIIGARKSLSKDRINKLQNDILSCSSPNMIEKLRASIKKEKEKTDEKIRKLEEKTNLVGSFSSKGLCVIIVK